jgi:orotate phosphoribosyltransferase
MKNIDDMIQKAEELQSKGLVTGQIADELNVSRETITWLLTRAKKDSKSPAPKDISVDWSMVGKNSCRLRYISNALADMTMESACETDSEIDTIVGIGLSGVPLASHIANDLDKELAIFHGTTKQNEDKRVPGTVSRNFGEVTGKNCVVVDDVITSGATITEVINQLRDFGANPVVVTVIIDKKGSEKISDVPVKSMVRIVRVD